MSNKPKTVFVTGASGFIASNIIESLYNGGCKIFGSSREPKNYSSDKVKILAGNFYDTEFLEQLKKIPIDIIIHCAAIRGQSDLPGSEYKKVNVRGTEKLLQFANENRVSRFLFFSTVGVLGTIPNSQPASIKNYPNPDNNYHQSKWAAEELVRKYHAGNPRTLILRPTITYGPGDEGFIFKLNRLIQNRGFVFPRKPVKIHLLDVHALSKLIQTIIQNDLFDDKAYLVADREPVILKELVDFFSNRIHGRSYPGYLQMPNFIFSLTKNILKLLSKRQLLTSIQLISDNWTYDITETISRLGYKPMDTLESIS